MLTFGTKGTKAADALRKRKGRKRLAPYENEKDENEKGLTPTKTNNENE